MNSPSRWLWVVVLAACATPRNGARAIGDVEPAPPLPACVTLEPGVEVHRTAEGMPFVRTPDARFEASRAAYPYAPKYVEVEGLRLGYVDEGPNSSGETILLLHGQPDWSYLYRKMIPPLVAAGHRVIALDLVGFGRSDKPTEQKQHTFENHVRWVKAFIAQLGLEHVTLFCQDWGGLIGLRVVGERPEWFKRVVTANTTLPVFSPAAPNPYFLPADVSIDCAATSLARGVGPSMLWGNVAMFNAWIRYTLTSPTFTASEVMTQQIPGLPKADAEAYDAPFPSFIYRAGPRTLPSMIVAVTNHDDAAWEALGHFTRPFLSLAGERDKLLGRQEVQDRLISHVPGAKGQAHARFPSGHFIQDELGEVMAAKVNAFIRDTP